MGAAVAHRRVTLRGFGMAKANKLLTEVVERLRPIMKFDPIEDRASYSIGAMAAHLRVTLRTLRFYEQAGLLAPSREGLRRLYALEDLQRLEVIVTLRELEISLPSIKAVMTAIDGEGEISAHEVLERVAATLVGLVEDNLARIAELEQINARIAEAQPRPRLSRGAEPRR